MVDLPTVQPANVFGSFMQGAQARQQQDRNALLMAGERRDQAKEALLALGAVYKKAKTEDEFQSGVTALQKMGYLNPGETVDYDRGLAVLAEAFGPEANSWGNLKVVGGHVLRPDGRGGAEVAWSPPAKPGYRTLSPEEAANRGLPEGNYQISPQGQITAISTPKGQTFRPATPEELARYGAKSGQIDTASGRFYPGRGDGMTVYDPATGNPIMTTGDPSAPLGRAGMNDLDKGEINSRSVMARLDGIRDQIAANPDLLNSMTLRGDLERLGLTWAEYIGGQGTLDPEQERRLVAVTQLRGDVLDNLNYTIKEITGAAMTEAEAARIGATMPNVNDSPTVFMAKLEGATERTRAAVARYNYWRNGGFGNAKDAPSAATLSDMEGIMSRRAEELARQVEAGEIDAASASATFAKEFGI